MGTSFPDCASGKRGAPRLALGLGLGLAPGVLAFVLAWFVLLRSFSLPYLPGLFWPLLSLAPVGAFFLCRSRAVVRRARTVALFALTLFALAVALLYMSLYRGALLLYNSGLTTVSLATQTPAVLYAHAGSAGEATLVLCLAALLFALPVGYGIARAARGLVAAATLPLALLPVLCGAPLPAFAFAGYLVCALLATAQNTLLPRKTRSHTKWTVAPQKHTPSRPGVAWAVLPACAALCAGILLCALPPGSYVTPQAVTDLQAGVLRAANNLRYGGNATLASMPRGDLAAATGLSYTDQTAVVLEMQTPHALYLRAYVGGDYAQNAWSPPTDASYGGESAGVLEWLARRDFYPWCQPSALHAMTANAQTTSVTLRNMALFADQLYLPYDALPAGEISPDAARYDYDRGVFAYGLTGDREYTFRTYLPTDSDFMSTDYAAWVAALEQSSDYAAYAQSEQAYRAFVYRAYTSVPQDAARALSRCFGESTLASLRTSGVKDVVQSLRREFSDNFVYSSEMTDVIDDTYILDEFLNKSRSGYDCHFATAATLLLRQSGIPARYVEGYYLPPEEMQPYADMRDMRFYVSDAFCHAWVEIYVDGVGFVPVEVTPGYYTPEDRPSEETAETDAAQTVERHLQVEDAPVQTPPPVAPQAGQTKESARALDWLLWVGCALGLLAAFSLALCLRSCLYRKRRARAFASADTNAAALRLYAYVRALLSTQGVPATQPPEACASLVRKVYDAKAADGLSFSGFVRLTYRARYSGKPISPSQRDAMQTYATRLASYLYAEQSRPRKLWLRWWKGLM